MEKNSQQTLNLHYPSNPYSKSKSIWVMDAFAESNKHLKVYKNQYNIGTGVFWGLADYNSRLIKQYNSQKSNWIFTDMPYWHRFSNNRNQCYWRIIPNSLHCFWQKNYPSDRFKKLNVTLKDWRTNGDYILVCPSSQAMDIFYNQHNWLKNTLELLKKYTDRPVRVRLKPKKGEIKIPFEEECKNAWAIVTMASIAGVEAACLGIPVFCHNNSPAAPIGINDISKIEKSFFPDRTNWVNTLSYFQYTEDEIKKGLYKEFVNDYFLL